MMNRAPLPKIHPIFNKLADSLQSQNLKSDGNLSTLKPDSNTAVTMTLGRLRPNRIVPFVDEIEPELISNPDIPTYKWPLGLTNPTITSSTHSLPVMQDKNQHVQPSSTNIMITTTSDQILSAENAPQPTLQRITRQLNVIEPRKSLALPDHIRANSDITHSFKNTASMVSLEVPSPQLVSFNIESVQSSSALFAVDRNSQRRSAMSIPTNQYEVAKNSTTTPSRARGNVAPRMSISRNETGLIDLHENSLELEFLRFWPVQLERLYEAECINKNYLLVMRLLFKLYLESGY
ncbi:hypothetical protein HK096_006524 [Nowakowskiella sp. JEL0078]|nr:hypothetical protein HK096_006524 [Nowakowskiella sp. JEL0078]